MKYIYPLLFLLIAVSVLAEDSFRIWNRIGGGYFEAKLNAVQCTSLQLENRKEKLSHSP